MFARNKAKSGQAGQPAGDVPLSVAQRTAAKRLLESKQTIPHYYLQRSINAASMMARREASKEARLAWDAFFVQAVACATRRYDRFACRFEGDRLSRMKEMAVGVAIDHDGELYVIPVADPANKTVEAISGEIRRNVERLKSGDPDARMIRPAAMTVSNLGVCNVESFTPIINPPETAILGIGRTAPTLVAREDGSFAVEHRCTLTLSIDHRIASGRYAADFLNAIVEELEATQ
jgi:pyruvate dehydrogenase E2 component (dihydrolipoamide acetyltransferase)